MEDLETSKTRTAPVPKEEHWIRKTWRPAMAWLYMSTCFFDFIAFPIMWAVVQLLDHTATISQWSPLTLQNGGLYHLAMGAVLGITAFGRTQEKKAAAD